MEKMFRNMWHSILPPALYQDHLLRTTVGDSEHLVKRLPGRILDCREIGSIHGNRLKLSLRHVQHLH